MHTKPALAHAAHTGAIYALAIAPDGAVLSGGGDGAVLSWRTDAPDLVNAVARTTAPVQAILPCGDLLLLGTATGELFVISTTRKSVVQGITAHAKGIYAMAALGSDRIACAGGDGILSIWQLGTGTGCERVRNIPLCDAKLRGLALDHRGDRLAVACGDGTVRVLETTDFNEVNTYAGHAEGANTVVFHPTKPVLVSGGKDGHIRVWESAGSRQVMAIAAHRSTIYQLAFDSTASLLASASRDKSVKLWDANTFEPIDRLDAEYGGHSHSVNAVVWSGRSLFTAGDDRKLLCWTPPAHDQQADPTA